MSHSPFLLLRIRTAFPLTAVLAGALLAATASYIINSLTKNVLLLWWVHINLYQGRTFSQT